MGTYQIHLAPDFRGGRLMEKGKGKQVDLQVLYNVRICAGHTILRNAHRINGKTIAKATKRNNINTKFLFLLLPSKVVSKENDCALSPYLPQPSLYYYNITVQKKHTNGIISLVEAQVASNEFQVSYFMACFNV